jgi:radical SAM/Cys-rich protein
MCNQTCRHCHVDAGPDRKEKMSRETLEDCIHFIKENGIRTVDLTGGAPEMHPDFRWLVEELSTCNVHILVRCNLTIILANKRFYDLPDFFAKHRVEVISSLPHYTANRTDRQRGEGVFDQSIRAIRLLNDVGYGQEGSGLQLNLVYNPTGALLPGDQQGLERDFKNQLKQNHDCEFNHLFCITNMPISRFLTYLLESGNLASYMEKLVDAYNPLASSNVMCRNTLSVGWDGLLYDCDFNQMLELPIATANPSIKGIRLSDLSNRSIRLANHCYGCTAGSGSCCGGEIV